MLIGYNTNVPYKGKMYHVQTEDSGPGRPAVVTLLYRDGAILKSKKTGYDDLVGKPDAEDRVRELMKEQHKAMIKHLISGAVESTQGGEAVDAPSRQPAAPGLNEQAGPPREVEQPKTQKGRSLDDILLEHIARKVKER
jgi:hypothetical protein